MKKQEKIDRSGRRYVYTSLRRLAFEVRAAESALEPYVEKGYIQVAKIGDDGERLFDLYLCVKRIQNVRKWRGKGLSDEEMIKKLDSAIENTHRWGDGYTYHVSYPDKPITFDEGEKNEKN